MSIKQKAFRTAMSPYIRLRDAIDYYKQHGFIFIGSSVEELIVQCCTCPKVNFWKEMDAGHFIGRGLGGGSGVYLDERNVHVQCPSCNRFREGMRLEYNDFMLKKYNQEVIDELRRLDVAHKYTQLEIEGLRLYYKAELKKLKESLK